MAAALAAGACLAAAGSAASAPAVEGAVFTGYGFESCNAPSLDALGAWLGSPYRAVGIYIGGTARTCANAGLTADWVAGALAGGWSLIPTYVGLQAPCNAHRVHFTAPTAATQGTAAADDAIAKASALGLPGGSPLYYDMESYSLHDPACTQAVQTFVSAWVAELHAHGWVAGVYGSATSTGRDLQALAGTPSSPDDVWIANWNGQESVFGDPYVVDSIWTSHQRIHQYRGGHRETWGGAALDVDSDYVDGAVVSPTGAPAPAAPPPASTSATTDDGGASATWPSTAFGADADIGLTSSVPGLTLPGYGSGGYGVQLEVTAMNTLAAVHVFSAPVTIRFAPRQSRLAPVFSANGTVWKHVPPLAGDAIGAGARTGYARGADGGFTIQTTVAGFFALVPDRIPPAPPASVTGRLAGGGLELAWQQAVDPNGPIAGYEVTVTNRPLASLPRSVRSDRLTGFRAGGPTVYRVVAIDAAGNESRPSQPVVVLPSTRPHDLPKTIPAWAWRLFDWQQSGRADARPKAPRAVPDWWWRWYGWRALPFHLRR
jgi:hypothetical protein